MTVRELLEGEGRGKEVLIEEFDGSAFPYDGSYRAIYSGWEMGTPFTAKWMDLPVLEVVRCRGAFDSIILDITYAARSMFNAVDNVEVVV